MNEMSAAAAHAPFPTDGAVDESPLDRPGIPAESSPPEPLASAHWITPERQTTAPEPLVGHGLELTPIFSTAIPAQGLSGVLRRAAYRIPDYRAGRWLLLLFADRVDVLEQRPKALLRAAGVAGLLGAGILAARRLGNS
jgi:hypothetical protein